MLTCRSCGNPNAAGASVCRACGGSDLAKGAGATAAGCLARALAWGLALAALRLLFAGGWLQRSSGWLLEYVFGRSFSSAAESLVTVIVAVGTLALAAECAVGDRVPVFKPFARAVGKALGLAPRAAAWSVRALLCVIEGVGPSKERKPAKKEGKEAPP